MAPQEVKFTENRLGGVALVIDGCKYRINRRSGTTVYWRCFFRWCHANAVVEDGKLKSSCGKHICQQPLNGGAHTKAGRHHQRQLEQQPQQTPSSVIQQTEVQQRPRPVAAAASSSGVVRSGPTVKMATRAAQGSTTQTLTRNANKAKVALRSQKPPTNNNLVVRRKSKAIEEDNKSNVLLQQPASTVNSPQTNITITHESNSPPKQVRQLVPRLCSHFLSFCTRFTCFMLVNKEHPALVHSADVYSPL